MNTTEGNKLIAEFMGSSFKTYKKGHIRKDSVTVCYFDDGMSPFSGGVSIENLRYNASWDWLMPVVEKIQRMKMKNGDWFMVSIGNFQTMIMRKSKLGVPYFNDEIITGTEKGKTWSVWMAACEFIEWYNENKTA